MNVLYSLADVLTGSMDQQQPLIKHEMCNTVTCCQLCHVLRATLLPATVTEKQPVDLQFHFCPYTEFIHFQQCFTIHSSKAVLCCVLKRLLLSDRYGGSSALTAANSAKIIHPVF